MLAIIVHSLGRIGGTESVVKLLANYFVNHKIADVVVLETEKSSYKNSGNDQFQVINLATEFKNEKINMFFSMVKVKNYIKKNNIKNVYSTFGNLNILSILLLKNVNLIVCDHTCYKQSMIGFFGYLRKCLYRYADYVISLTNRDFENYRKDKCNCIVIPNPVDKGKIFSGNYMRKGFIAVGRICYSKNYERMVNICAYLKKLDNYFSLRIFGDGDKEYVEKIKNIIQQYDLENNVLLQNSTSSISEWYAKSRLLLMTSYYEGLPMVLIEAQANGLPCVAIDIETGPSDIIINNETGLLLNENLADDEMAKRIFSFYTDVSDENFIKSKKNAEQFNIEHIIDKWMNILNV
ncbi:MAG TPA: glycosyltransferase [Arsenophonus apicola]|uniref:glycosyltransferase n=1 Tax=Arsenophonus apicola TaxID=2879119 RepID=UPI00387916E9